MLVDWHDHDDSDQLVQIGTTCIFGQKYCRNYNINGKQNSFDKTCKCQTTIQISLLGEKCDCVSSVCVFLYLFYL